MIPTQEFLNEIRRVFREELDASAELDAAAAVAELHSLRPLLQRRTAALHRIVAVLSEPTAVLLAEGMPPRQAEALRVAREALEMKGGNDDP